MSLITSKDERVRLILIYVIKSLIELLEDNEKETQKLRSVSNESEQP